MVVLNDERKFQMKVYMMVILAAVIFLFTVLSSVPSFALFFDFNDNQKPKEWDEVGGKWKVKNGEYVGEEPAATEGVTAIGEQDWTDLTIEVTVRNAQGNWMALVVRWNDKNNQYGWWVNLGSSTGEWWVKNAGQYVADAVGAIQLDRKEYRLKIVAQGDTFEGYYNDKLIATMKHKQYKSGRTGLLVWEGSSSFDDIQITGKGIPELAVKPSGKCTTTWGRIKQNLGLSSL